MADTRLYLQTQATSLYGAGAVLGATSVILSSLVDLEGNAIAMTDIGTLGFGTIEPGASGVEEAITFTGITQNANGTATLTGVKNQLGKAPYTQTAGLLRSHAGGSIFVLSNTAGFYDSISGKNNDETITAVWTFTAPNYPRMDSAAVPPVTDPEFATKKYVDDTAIAGAPKATEAVYGISKLSSAAVDPTAPVVLNNEEVSATFGANKVVKAGAGGKIDTGFIDQTANYTWSGTQNFDSATISGITKFGGTGADGALTITTGTTTLDLGAAAFYEKNYSSISITGDGKLTFSNPHANGTIIVLKSKGNVTITSSNVPAIDASGMGGTGGATGDGSFGNSVLSISNPGTMNADTTTAKVNGGIKYCPVSPSIFYRNIPLACGGGGGAGNPSSTVGGGAGGGALMIECGGLFSGSSTIYAKGVAGADKANTGGGSKSQGGGGGASITGSGTSGNADTGSNAAANTAGGGGGGGGTVIILYKSLTSNTTTITVTAGAGGAGHVAGGAGANGYSYVGLAVIN